ncbi:MULTISPECIES: hypothetical protein [Streptomyces]|uniref:Uncharacterized protein n=2 Tax=Streptomyces TaxID=1883 RepID=A0A286DU94_9ACTN|nr:MULTISPECIES: hypothetical protein [Streptomyces]TNM32738.1 hypothetical protein FH715_05275 [Streptomyces sedi]SOD62173.1 hypothetical protein SAMN06297387_104343 [Streptomyces zhaozhouensis]
MTDKWVDAVTVEREGFRINVPDSWWEFDLRPETRDNSIRRMVDERVRANPEMAEHREVIAGFLRKQAKHAWDNGSVYCGCMAQSFGDGPPITATVTVSLIGARTSSGEILPTDPAAIIGQLGNREAKKPGDAWREVSVIDIPDVGRVARTKGVEDIKVPNDSRTARAVLMQTFIPVPGDQQAVALVSGSSQVLDLADSFFDVFDAITSTFRFA